MTDQKRIIEPPKSSIQINFIELRRYKQLIYSLAWRDIKVKYAQTIVGVLWAVINPFIIIVVLSFVFQNIAKIETSNVPPFLYVLCGYIPWSYFSAVTSSAGDSFVSAQDMIKKIYFPRIILPLSKALSGLVEYTISFCILLILLLYYQYIPSHFIIYFPFFMILNLAAGLAIGILTSSFTIRYRDFRFIVPVALQLGLFLSPIAYPVEQIPDKFQFLYSLNPMVGIIEGIRWSILGVGEPFYPVIISTIIVIFILVFALFYFSKVEKTMADII